MNETTILRQPGSTRWVVFQPSDGKFMKMKLVCGFTGETYCEWFILKKDTPLMIASWEADKYRILSTISNNNLNDDANEKESETGEQTETGESARQGR